MGLLEMLVQRKLDERDQWKQDKQSQEALANTMVAKGNLSPAQLEVIRQIGNKWGSEALMNYYGEAYPQAVATQDAANQQLLRQQQMGQAIHGKVMPMLTGGQQQQQAAPQATSQPNSVVATPSGKKLVIGTPVTSGLYTPKHELTPLVAGAMRAGETGGASDAYTLQNRQGAVHTGAYQWHPNTWRDLSSQFAREVLGTPVKQLEFNKDNQDAVALWAMDRELMRSNNPENVARMWYTGNPESKLTRGVGSANSGAAGIPYDVPGYVSEFSQRLGEMQKRYGGGAQMATQGVTTPAFQAPAQQQQAPTRQTQDFGSMLEQMANQMTYTTHPDGSVTVSGKLGAVPTMEQHQAVALEQLRQTDPAKYRSIVSMGLLKSADANKTWKMEYNKDAGRYFAIGLDPITQETTQIPLERSPGMESAQMTRDAEARQARQKEIYTALGKEEGQYLTEADRTAREQREKAAAYKEPSQKDLEGAQGIQYTSDRIASKLDQLKRFTGQYDTGAMVVDKIPTGKLDAVLQKAQQFGIGDVATGIMRTQLEGLSTDLMSLLYYISVGNVSDQEMRSMTGLQASIDQPPHIYVTKLTDVWDMLERKAKAQIDTFKQTGRDVRGQEQALKFLQQNNPMKLFPKAYQDSLSPVQRQAPSLADEWGAVKGGK